MKVDLSNVKKGDKVILYLFTGLACSVKEVLKADKNTITIETNRGKSVFSRKTGKMIEPEVKSERFASYITPDDGSFVPNSEKGSKKKSKKANDKKVKKGKSKPVDEDEDDDEDEPEVKPKAKKSKVKAKPKAKKKPDPDEDEEIDEEEYEEEE